MHENKEILGHGSPVAGALPPNLPLAMVTDMQTRLATLLSLLLHTYMVGYSEMSIRFI